MEVGAVVSDPRVGCHCTYPPYGITMIHGGELPKQFQKIRGVFLYSFFQEIPVEGYTIGSADRAYFLRTWALIPAACLLG